MASIFNMKDRPNLMLAYFDTSGRRRIKSSGTTDRKAAKRLADELEKKTMLVREGLVDPRAEQLVTAARAPLESHLSNFLQHLRDRDSSPKHVADRENQVRRLLKAGKMRHARDITPARVHAGLNRLRTERQLSASTSNRYLRAVKALGRWMMREGLIEHDPLLKLEGFNVNLDRRHERRALTDDEISKLVAAAENGPEHRGLSGGDRAVLYLIALGTGFRANEIRSLVPESFDLDADPPTITVRAGYSKNRRPAVQPIRRDLANRLRGWLDTKPVGRPVFDVPHLHHRTAHMVRFDLERAGIDYVDENGKVADFHALRHTFITAVVRSGANVKQLQVLARHSTPMLSLQVYSHVGLTELGEAIEAMPALAGVGGEDSQTLPSEIE